MIAFHLQGGLVYVDNVEDGNMVAMTMALLYWKSHVLITKKWS